MVHLHFISETLATFEPKSLAQEANLEPKTMSAGGFHTVLLRNDGSAVACGKNNFGQGNIPPLHEGISYTQVSAGELHTVLLRSDGSAVACGDNTYGQCNIPPLDKGGHTPRFLQVIFIQCFFEVMAGLFLAEKTQPDNATFRC